MKHALNFYAGPSVLPVEVLEEIQQEMVDYQNTGLSLIETSHRSKEYDAVHMSVLSSIRDLLEVPDNFKILLLGGGATLQFSMIPLNFLSQGQSCDFTLTGAWAKKAYEDAQKVGKVNVLFDGKEQKYCTLPKASTLKPHSDSAYLHLTSNETIGGVQWKDWPDTQDVPLVCDMSSDILSKPIPVDKFSLIYAGAQKNLGPSGATIVIIRDDMLARCPDNMTAYLDYKIHAAKDSLYNTPPVFPIYAMSKVLTKVKKDGGMAAVVKRNQEKAGLLYDAIDNSKGFYSNPVAKEFRSEMNVVFTLPTPELEKAFIEEAKTSKNMFGLKGHKSVGGCRASIYNSLKVEYAAMLADFMKEFQQKNS